MRAAVVQLNSQDDLAANLACVRRWIGQAAAEGARLVCLPENFAFMGEEAVKCEIAEAFDASPRGPIVSALADSAAKHGVWVIGGGMPERSSDPRRPYNASVVIDGTGRVAGVYRKVHLFDVVVPDGTAYNESRATMPGQDAVAVDIHGVKVGLSVCYDLRFPELYRRLVDLGSRVITVPAAFTLATGKDHWVALLRARAIENQVYVLAPAQSGKHPRGRQTFGKALIADPWGDVVAQCSDGEGFACATLDFAFQDRVRAALPCAQHRVW